jgi:ribosomal protein S18 acetylase RimI-like enzyme
MTGQPVTLRGMRAEDLPFAASLTLGEGWQSETLEELEGFHERDPAACLIAERAGRRVGIGIATAYGNAGFLGEIVVHPACRGQGIGDQLVGALVTCLHRQDVHTI